MKSKAIAATFIILLLILAGCEAQATPIALVTEPTGEAAVATALPTNPPNLRYGLYANTEGYVSDLAAIQSRAAVETVYDGSQLTDYDVVVAYGLVDVWQVSPVRQHLSLLINPNLAPMDNEVIRSLIPQAIDSPGLIASLGMDGVQPNAIIPLARTEIRNSLANMGYPDGLLLTLASSPVPGLETLLADLTADNILIQLVDAGNEAHLSLTLAPEVPEGAIEIYSLPISYFAKEGISLEFSANGWPLPSR